MLQKKYQEVLFTLLTSGLMIYCMGVYNVALHTGGLTWSTFAHAAHSFPLEWAVGFLCALLIAGPLAPSWPSGSPGLRIAPFLRSSASRPSPSAQWCR